MNAVARKNYACATYLMRQRFLLFSVSVINVRRKRIVAFEIVEIKPAKLCQICVSIS